MLIIISSLLMQFVSKNIIVAVQTLIWPVPALETGYIPQIYKSVVYNWEPVFSLEQFNGKFSR